LTSFHGMFSVLLKYLLFGRVSIPSKRETHFNPSAATEGFCVSSAWHRPARPALYRLYIAYHVRVALSSFHLLSVK
jgi:hypothetical protein